MIPYLLVAVAAFVLALLSQWIMRWSSANNPDAPPVPRLWNPVELILVVLLIVFSGARFGIGTDYKLYVRLYGLLDPNADWFQQITTSVHEYGFTMLSLILRSWFGESAYPLFWVAAILTVVPIYATLRKQSKDLPFAILLYVLLAFYVSPFNIVRQGIAIALNFWAYTFLGKRTWLFVVINVIAASFHTSAGIAAIAQLGVRLWKPKLPSTIVVLVSAGIFAGAAWALPVVNNLASLLSERYENYLADGEGGGLGTYLVIVAYVLILILVFVMRNSIERQDWLAMLVVAVALQLAGTQVVVAARLFFYFAIFVLLLLPNLLAARKVAFMPKTLITVGAAAYFYAYLSNFGQLIPYDTYLW